jgi:AraC family transcriptional regulator
LMAAGQQVEAVTVIRRALFESDTLQIGLFAVRPVSDACGDVERQVSNVVVLPVSGVFARHDASGRHVIGTPSHAVLVPADTPHRLSFPGAIGDRALILRFGDSVAFDQRDCNGGGADAGLHGLLPAHAMMLRNLLWTRLQRAEADEFEAEALGLDLLEMALASMRADRAPPRRAAHVRRMQAMERVKEAVAMAPADAWTVAGLAKVANLSPFHLCHVFRETVGTSIYDYVLQERLAGTLDVVLDGGGDLTAIALDAGFASHSHFTAHFRKFFGCTPTALRRVATAARTAELRKIVTARRRRLS